MNRSGTARRRPLIGAAPVALAVIAGGCTASAGPEPRVAPGEPVPIVVTGLPEGRVTHTPPPPGSFVTSIVRESLAEPVIVPGEPERPATGEAYTLSNHPTSWDFNQFPVAVHFPRDWQDHDELSFCNWTEVDGFYECTVIAAQNKGGRLDLAARLRGLHDRYELWLMPREPGQRGRRLYQVPDSLAGRWPLELELPPEYQRVNDVLTTQPGPDGNYLVQVERP